MGTYIKHFDRKRSGFLFLTFLLILPLTCLVSSSYSQNFYPDTIGNTWTLRSTDATETRTFTIKGPVTVNGEVVSVIEDQTSDSISSFFVRTEADGVKLFRSVLSVPLLEEVVFDYSPPQLFLPASLELGTSWNVESTASVPLVGEIQAINRLEVTAIEDVISPIGTFSGALKVTQDTTLVLGTSELMLTTAMWFAPGVGIVQATDLNDVVFELIDFDIAEDDIIAPWDVNSDGTVDLFDLVRVAGQFGQIGDALEGDVNGNGTVDIFDLVLVGNHFGESTNTPASG